MAISASDRIARVESTPTVDTSAYASGDLIGDKIELTSATPGSNTLGDGGSGIIQSVTITDLGKQDANIDVVFFDADPSNTTFTDNSALDVNDTDLLNIIGVAHVTDWSDFNDNSVGVETNLAIPFVLDSGTSLFACLVSRGTPTYASTSDLTLRVNILPL